MTNKEQRRKKDNNKPSSRLPIPISTAETATTTTITKHRHNNNITTTVTLSKLDNKKNKKSNLFATTCSRRAQEEKNYNKRPIINKKNLSFFYLPPPTCKNNKNMNNSVQNKSLIPAATSRRTVTQLQKPTTLRKSPITQLKEDLEHLRKQNKDDESLIKEQNEEILNLKKKLLAKQEAGAKECPSIEVVELLQVESPSNNLKYEREINKLQIQLKTQKDDFEKKLAQYTTIEIEMDNRIQQGQELLNRLKLDHTNQLAQLNDIHKHKIQKLQTEHEKDLNYIKNQYTKSINKPKTDTNNDQSVNDIIEQALKEFEQEQHQHLPSPIKSPSFRNYDSNERSLERNLLTSIMMKNQQWYAKKYMPVEAVSWPAPKGLSHLKRAQQQQIC